jgi:hypothetical protein
MLPGYDVLDVKGASERRLRQMTVLASLQARRRASPANSLIRGAEPPGALSTASKPANRCMRYWAKPPVPPLHRDRSASGSLG